jgi:hypothetical protein
VASKAWHALTDVGQALFLYVISVDDGELTIADGVADRLF